MTCYSPLLSFTFPDAAGQPRRVEFDHPAEVLVANHLDEVRPLLRRVQAAVDAGFYAAGYVGYEAAPAFDPALVVRGGAEMPLAWFGLFETPSERETPAPGQYRVSDWRPSAGQAEHARAVDALRGEIAQGNTYQVNYTLRLEAEFAGDDFAFYQRLCAAQRGAYHAYLNLGRHRVLSVSPELFFRRQGDTLTTRPMKGTVPRGRWASEDAARAEWLKHSEKNRAENVMIVDLLRNDLGRIAEIGSVRVPRLFDIEPYPTVLQMTSTVTGEARPDTTLEDVFAALFPCGSVTGAPKVSTMTLIAEWETAPREVYCGAIGMMAPGGEAVFSVAIRTVLLDTRAGTARYGVGGGITWDSEAGDEYREALAKSAVLTEPWPAFDLLETMRLDAGTYALWERHLERLRASAQYFHFACDLDAVRAALRAHAHAFPKGPWRVRLLLSEDGRIALQTQPLTPLPPAPLCVALAQSPVSSQDRFLCHKTTHRACYEAHRVGRGDVFDVLLWNERGELTEFTLGNLIIELGGHLWTPPRTCGLLAGTLRAELLARGEIRERIMTKEDLARASGLWLLNSVRGKVAAVLAQ